MPARQVEEAKGCRMGFEFCLGYDPTNSHYYGWLKNQLTKRGEREAYKTHMKGSENEEL